MLFRSSRHVARGVAQLRHFSTSSSLVARPCARTTIRSWAAGFQTARSGPNHSSSLSLSSNSLLMQPKTLLSTQKGFFSDKAAEGQASPDAEAAAAAAGEGAAAAEPDASAEQIEKLENELKSVQKTMEETKKKHLLDLAEMENVRRRTKLDIEENRKYATQGMGKEIVEVCDTLMMAIKNSEKDLASGENPQLQTLYDGLTLIEKNMMHVLSKHHIKKYESLGKAFDPNVHDGIYEIPCAEREVGTVGEVMKEGFTLHDRIIRVAQVGTIKRPPAAQ